MITTSPWILAYAAGALVMFRFGVGMVAPFRTFRARDLLEATLGAAFWPVLLIAWMASYSSSRA